MLWYKYKCSILICSSVLGIHSGVFHFNIYARAMLWNAQIETSSFTGLPPPPLSPEYHVQLFGQHNITVVVQWRHPEYDGLVDNYTISGTHFVTTISENNGTTLTLPYNEYQNIRITSNNCIGSSRTTAITFFEGNECQTSQGDNMVYFIILKAQEPAH